MGCMAYSFGKSVFTIKSKFLLAYQNILFLTLLRHLAKIFIVSQQDLLLLTRSHFVVAHVSNILEHFCNITVSPHTCTTGELSFLHPLAKVLKITATDKHTFHYNVIIIKYSFIYIYCN